MIRTLPLVALVSLIAGSAAISTPAQAGESCKTCTTKYQSYSVPDPTRRGAFISHFNAAGAPQSLTTPSESDTVCEEYEYINAQA